MRVDVQAVVTNKTPNAPYRGAGRPETVFAMDRIVDCLARELRMDPAELRRRNYIRPDELPVRLRHALSRRQSARVRHRRFSRGAREGAGGRGLPDVPGRAAALAGARDPPRHRHLRLRRGHRDRPVRGRDGQARSGRPRARGDGRDQLGPGPRDQLRPGRRRRPRRSDRLGDRDRRRHRGGAVRRRDLREPQRGHGRQLDRRRVSRGADEAGRAPRRRCSRRRRTTSRSRTARSSSRARRPRRSTLARVIQASIPTFAKPGVAPPDFEATRLSPRADRDLCQRRPRGPGRGRRRDRPGDAAQVRRRPRLRSRSSIRSSSRGRCTAASRRVSAARSSRRWSTTRRASS